VQAAFLHADKAAQAVGRYIESNRAFPRSLADAGFSEPLPPGIQRLAIDPGSGELRVTVNVASLRGRSFHLEPTIEAAGKVRWRCLHGELPVRLLPNQCNDNPGAQLEL
jgi:hypothetical protein